MKTAWIQCALMHALINFSLYFKCAVMPINLFLCATGLQIPPVGSVECVEDWSMYNTLECTMQHRGFQDTIGVSTPDAHSWTSVDTP